MKKNSWYCLNCWLPIFTLRQGTTLSSSKSPYFEGNSLKEFSFFFFSLYAQSSCMSGCTVYMYSSRKEWWVYYECWVKQWEDMLCGGGERVMGACIRSAEWNSGNICCVVEGKEWWVHVLGVLSETVGRYAVWWRRGRSMAPQGHTTHNHTRFPPIRTQTRG
jgi:hypothetical protein